MVTIVSKTDTQLVFTQPSSQFGTVTVTLTGTGFTYSDFDYEIATGTVTEIRRVDLNTDITMTSLNDADVALLSSDNQNWLDAIVEKVAYFDQPLFDGAEIQLNGAQTYFSTSFGLSDIINGSVEDDMIFGFNNSFEINADAGNDTVYGYEGDDIVNGGDGNDDLYGDAASSGSATGLGGIDELFGGAGDDTANGGRGDDLIFGGKGDDDLSGGWSSEPRTPPEGLTDDDRIHGGEGNDEMFGHNGDDLMRGNADNDLMFGGSGTDDIGGGRGSDSIFGDNGSDSIFGGRGNDVIFGGGFKVLEDDDVLYGRQGQDEIFGGAGKDTISGGKHDDVLVGGRDDDVINGGKGADLLYGQGDSRGVVVVARQEPVDVELTASGIDTLTGGAGRDTFAFDDFDFVDIERVDAPSEIVLITDFEDGKDKLMILQRGELSAQEQFDLFSDRAFDNNGSVMFSTATATVVIENMSIDDISVDDFELSVGQIFSDGFLF